MIQYVPFAKELPGRREANDRREVRAVTVTGDLWPGWRIIRLRSVGVNL
jgi:hypothetical protein